MILESEQHNPSNSQFTHSFENNYTLNEKTNEENSVARLKWNFHHKIRIRQLEKIKAAKRNVLKANTTIELILQSQFPKQSDQAKQWAFQLVKLFDTSKKYETDPFKLRQIFILAQKFPNIATLRLFYLAVINSSSQNVRTLFDLDVWRFLHNILLFPNVKSLSSNVPDEQSSYSPSSKNLNTHFVEVEMIKASIETFVCLFKKDIGFRDFSIGNHQTFSNYIKPAYRKYGEVIKTELIYFLKQVFCNSPRQYSKEYLSIVKFTIKMLVEYMEKFCSFFNKKQWNELETKETVEQAVKRAGTLMAVMYKLFSYAHTKWMFDLVEGALLSRNLNYLGITRLYLTFGGCVLDQLQNNNQGLQNHLDFFENAIEFMYNCFAFCQMFADKTNYLQPQIVSQIPQILRKSVLMLNFFKKCEENKVFNEIRRQTFIDIEKTKQICLYTIDNSLNSEFDGYNNFIKSFIFFDDKNGEHINLLVILEYLLNTVHNCDLMVELINVFFSLVGMKVPQQEFSQYFKLQQMMEKFCDMLADRLTPDNIKQNICRNFLIFLGESFNNLGSHLRIEEIFERNLNKINGFMFSNMCSENTYENMEKVIKLLAQNKQKSQENSVLI